MVNSGDPNIEPRDSAPDLEPSDLMLAEAVTVSASAGPGPVYPDGAVPGCPRQRLHLNRALPLPDYGLPNFYRGRPTMKQTAKLIEVDLRGFDRAVADSYSFNIWD